MIWTDNQKSSAWDYEGTITSVSQIAENLDLSEDEVEELMLDCNIESCSGCGWWVESSELLDDNNEVCSCWGCRG